MAHEALANIDILARDGRELTADPAATGEKTYGRHSEVEALARALAARRCAVLLGPPGVGKTAIVQKLLHYLKIGRLVGLGGAKVYEISTVGLCADTRYTGMQEDKIRALLAHASSERLVYVSDLWNIPKAGSYETNPRGIYDLMRPGIEAQRLVLFGEMSAGRWEKLCREHPSLARDFATVTVAETTEAETREILWRAAGDLGAVVTFEKPAIDRVYSLAKKFLPTSSFPGKGVDLLRKLAQAARPASGGARAAPIDVEFVEETFGKQTGLPMHMISPRVQVTYDEMHRFLGERVVGQGEAVGAVADVLALYKTGLNNPDRPAGVLLFVGPTGVGKTELAKATAEFLFGSRDRIFRVNLSEYKDYHSFEKLIGDPRQNKTGLLTDHVRQHPFSVILLDEFEKGHSNLADLFLQVFDDGRLTDAYGETANFQHALLILTSNVGGEAGATGGIGFGGDARSRNSEEVEQRAMATRFRRALEAQYRPEFLNRIDRILVFHPLSQEDMRRIAYRELGKLYLREGLLERDLLLEVDEGVHDLLLDRGFDPKYGARPLKRAIEEILVIPLARALLSAEWRRFQLLRIARRGDGVLLTFEETESSRKLENLERRTGVDDGEGRVVRLSLADVQKGIRRVYERLNEIAARADIDKMRAELSEIEAKENRPGFWDEAFGSHGALVRRHRLAVEVRRYDDLRGRANLVRELVEASFSEAEDSVARELATEFARLERQLKRAERGIIRFDDADQGDAVIRVRPVGGREGATSWAESLVKMYATWAKDRNYDVEVTHLGGSAVLRVLGPYAFGYLKGEHGGHRIIAPPKDKHEKRGDTFLVRVDVSPASGERTGARPRSGPREFETSAPAEAPEDEPPIRTYDLWRSRGVRDRRTGHTEGDVRRILSGRINPFIEAFVDEPQS